MKLTEKWTRNKKGKMVSKCKKGGVSITKDLTKEKPYRLYVMWCSKGRFSTLQDVFTKIEGL